MILIEWLTLFFSSNSCYTHASHNCFSYCFYSLNVHSYSSILLSPPLYHLYEFHFLLILTFANPTLLSFKLLQNYFLFSNFSLSLLPNSSSTLLLLSFTNSFTFLFQNLYSVLFFNLISSATFLCSFSFMLYSSLLPPISCMSIIHSLFS